MKVFFIIPDLDAGGAERVTITIARLLKKNGYEVEFVNLGKLEGEMKGWIEKEFPMVSFEKGRVISALPKLALFMKKHKECLFFGSREHVNLVGLLAAKTAGVKMIVRVPNMPNNKLTGGISGMKMKIVKGVNKWLLPTAKCIIAQNEEMRQQLLEYYELDSQKVVTIYNPVDKDFVCSSANNTNNPYIEGETIFLAACKIQYSKGIDVLIKAWPQVKASIANAHMYIVGRDDSEYAINLKRQAQTLEDFTFVGFRDNPYPFMKYCDVFVLPSRMEGFPNVVLEAMCFNKPVVATTCVDVIKEIIKPNVNGYYCEIEEPEKLAKLMIEATGIEGITNHYSMFEEKSLINLFS